MQIYITSYYILIYLRTYMCHNHWDTFELSWHSTIDNTVPAINRSQPYFYSSSGEGHKKIYVGPESTIRIIETVRYRCSTGTVRECSEKRILIDTRRYSMIQLFTHLYSFGMVLVRYLDVHVVLLWKEYKTVNNW